MLAIRAFRLVLTTAMCIPALIGRGAHSISSKETLISIDSSYSIVLVGESHNSYGNDEIQYQLFKELIDKNKFNGLLLECGMGSAYVINKYLNCGDKNLWYIEPYYTTDRNFLDSLRFLQQRLDERNKFVVYGVDYEKNLSALLWALQDILRSSNMEDSVDQFVPKVASILSEFIADDNIEFKSRKKSKQILDSLLYCFDSSADLFIRMLGLHYDDFILLINNYRASKALYGGDFENSNSILGPQRERLIYSNIIRIPTSVKLFGQFGILHVNLQHQEMWWNKCNGWYSFGAMLNNELDSPYRGKVCCIALVYPHFEKRRKWKRTKTLGFTKIDLQKLFNTCQAGTWCIHNMKAIDAVIFENKFQYLIINRIADK